MYSINKTKSNFKEVPPVKVNQLNESGIKLPKDTRGVKIYFH